MVEVLEQAMQAMFACWVSLNEAHSRIYIYIMQIVFTFDRVATVRFGSVRFLKPFENLSPVSGGYS